MFLYVCLSVSLALKDMPDISKSLTFFLLKYLQLFTVIILFIWQFILLFSKYKTRLPNYGICSSTIHMLQNIPASAYLSSLERILIRIHERRIRLLSLNYSCTQASTSFLRLFWFSDLGFRFRVTKFRYDGVYGEEDGGQAWQLCRETMPAESLALHTKEVSWGRNFFVTFTALVSLIEYVDQTDAGDTASVSHGILYHRISCV